MALGPLSPIKDRLQSLSRRQRLFVAWALGVSTTLALPPLHWIVFLIPAFTGLVWLIQADARHRDVFWTGWWFGLGFFAAGLYWVSFALLVHADEFAWAIPIAALGLGGGFAFFPAVTVWAARRLAGSTSTIALILMLAVTWTALEWVRSWIATGFPWNLIGSVWAFSDIMLQPAALFGTYGLGLLTLIAAASPAALAHTRGWKMVLIGVVAVGLMGAGGGARLADAERSDVPDVRLRLVQPHIAQIDKWRQDLRYRHVVDQAKMGAAVVPDSPQPSHVIWAETAAPVPLAHDTKARAYIGSMTPPGGLTITGTVRTSAKGIKPFQVWNSLLAINPAGDIVGSYDKFHLVPFGEYMPFGETLGLKKITAGRVDFSAGPGPQTLSLPGLPPVSPLVCYEVIFPGAVTAPGARPDWLLNLTNDAWYRRTPGPFQHFTTARLRAVEEGLPVVRVANTGISGIIDPWGRVVDSLDLGRKGVLDGALPKPLKPTPYAQFGNAPVFAMMIVFIGAAGFRRRKDERISEPS